MVSEFVWRWNPLASSFFLLCRVAWSHSCRTDFLLVVLNDRPHRVPSRFRDKNAAAFGFCEGVCANIPICDSSLWRSVWGARHSNFVILRGFVVAFQFREAVAFQFRGCVCVCVGGAQIYEAVWIPILRGCVVAFQFREVFIWLECHISSQDWNVTHPHKIGMPHTHKSAAHLPHKIGIHTSSQDWNTHA
jgi:hypothetical protein